MSIVDQNVTEVKKKWDQIRHRVYVINKRALERAGKSSISAGQKHVEQKYAIRGKYLRDKKLIRARVSGDEFVVSIKADKLNVRDFTVREKWMSVSKDKSVSKINSSRRKESRRRNRVKVWQYMIIKGKWVTVPKGFAMAKAGNRLLQRVDTARTPIRAIYAPSLGEIFIETGTREVIKDKFYERYEIEYKRIADQ